MDFLLGSAQPQPPPLQSSWAPSSSSTASSSPGQQQQQQLELLLLQTYSALLSPTQPMSHHFPLNLLNLAAALGQPATMPALGQQQWPAAQLTTMPTMADPLEAFGVAFGTQLARHLAELPSAGLLLLPSNSVDSFPPGLALLPTCSPPNFHSRLLGPFAASHQITVEDLPPPVSPSETSASANDGGEAEGGSHQPNSKGHRAHRLSYPREFKLIVLHSFRANGHNKYRTCKEFQITKSMLNGWLQKADKIRNSRPGSLKSGRSGRRPQFPRIERQLFEQFRAQAAQGQTVSNRWIRETARQLAAAGQRQEDVEGNGIPPPPIQCQFSERWLNNFKRRFGIQTTVAGGTVPHNMEKEQHALEGEEHALDMMAFGDNNTLEEEEKQKSAAAVEKQQLQQQQTAMAEEMADSLLDEEKLTEEQWTKLGREICGSGQLPIQAFYARFPKLGQQQQPTAANLGRMGRKEEEEKQQKSTAPPGTVAEKNKWR